MLHLRLGGRDRGGSVLREGVLAMMPPLLIGGNDGVRVDDVCVGDGDLETPPMISISTDSRHDPELRFGSVTTMDSLCDLAGLEFG